MSPDPLTTFVAGHVLDRITDRFEDGVVRRWANYRGRRFIEQFVEQVRTFSGEPSDGVELEESLAGIIADDDRSAALYEALRYVFLSASREIGPRVLALHAAEGVAGLVDEGEVSDAVMAAASVLLDFEFEEFVGYATAHGVTDESFRDSVDELAIIMLEPVTFDSNWRGSRQETGPVYLRAEVGSWAQKLYQIGLIAQDISEEEVDYREDSEMHIDEPGTIRKIHRNIELREGTSHLLRLTRLAIRAARSAHK